MVPVLSKAIACTWLSASRKAPPLNKTPWRAPLLIPLIMLTGVLITRAQGQATTSKASARYNHPWTPGAGFQKGNPQINGGSTATSKARTTTAGV